MVGLVGVQSNQYPRALDIARPFREAGVPVVMGGFHISGMPVDAGRTAPSTSTPAAKWASRCSPARPRAASTRCFATPPTAGWRRSTISSTTCRAIEGTPVPFLPKAYVTRTLGQSASFDAGRGCPYQCSFCTIINVQGRKSRYRSADDVEHLVRLNWAQGISQILHHRRQFRPQHGLGSDLRPADRACAKRRASRSA